MDQHDDGLEAFLREQDVDLLASVLLELALDYDVVAQRLSRLRSANQPASVASQFQEILARWRRDDKYLKFPESSHFATESEIWLEQVERELIATDPSAVLGLAETFIEADADFFERVDDSYGDIGRAMDAACGLWLRAASRCTVPAGGWLPRLMALLSQDNYGGRHALLRDAGQLLEQSDVSKLNVSCS